VGEHKLQYNTLGEREGERERGGDRKKKGEGERGEYNIHMEREYNTHLGNDALSRSRYSPSAFCILLRRSASRSNCF